MTSFSVKTVLPVMLCAAALSGCATKGDIEALRSEISQMQQTNTEALAEAKAARELANATQQELDSVRTTAQAAVNRAEENELMINKSFEKSMQK